MNDLATQVAQTVGDTASSQAITNMLLGWMAFELRRAYPYLRALCAHFKLNIKTPPEETTPP